MQKVSKVKRFIAMTAMAAMLSITGLGVAQKNVQAANAKDESWSFSLSVNSNAFQYIKGRNKTDDSKIYINWSSTYGGNISQIQVYACGSNSEYGEPINASRKKSGDNPIYGFMYGAGKYSLTSYVHEQGLSYARPGMKSIKGSGTAKGVWSPVSIGTYKIIP